MKSLYELVEEQSLPLLEAYETDLTKHDYEEITENPNDAFIHVTRNYGTFLFKFSDPSLYPKKGEIVPYIFGHANRHHILKDSCESIVHMFKSSEVRLILYHNGKGKLKEINKDTAIEKVRDYERFINNFWRREA